MLSKPVSTSWVQSSAALALGVAVLATLAVQTADAQVVAYRIHPDILAELQDRYPEHATEYWNDVRDAIRDGINDWAELNPGLVFTPSHEDRYDVTIEWIDSSVAWGVEYHDRSAGNRIGIDFDTPEPDAYGASLMNPDVVRYVMAHELGHVLGIGHSAEKGHLMYGLTNPKPDRVLNDRGYDIPAVRIENYANVGGDKMNISFHLQGYHVHDVEVMDINGTQYLAVTTGSEGLYMLNVSDPSRPRLAGSYGGHTTDIWSLEGWPYIVQVYNGSFQVLDVTDPSNVTLASVVSHPDKANPILNATVIDVDGKPSIFTISTGLLQQYDMSDPYDIRRSGSYFDNFALLGAKDIQGVTRDIQGGAEGSTYVLVDADYDGILTFSVSADRNPALIRDRLNQPEYIDVIYEVITIADVTYWVPYIRGEIRLYETESGLDLLGRLHGLDPIGRLLGYTVLEIDTLRTGGAVYVVAAAGSDGILGIHIGDEGTGKWTFN